AAVLTAQCEALRDGRDYVAVEAAPTVDTVQVVEAIEAAEPVEAADAAEVVDAVELIEAAEVVEVAEPAESMVEEAGAKVAEEQTSEAQPQAFSVADL